MSIQRQTAAQEISKPSSTIVPVEETASTEVASVDGSRIDSAPVLSSKDEAADSNQSRVTVMGGRNGVVEKLRPRMERVRQSSSVVLDEAADDPSLRFVLIAAALFLLFIVLLLLSHLFG